MALQPELACCVQVRTNTLVKSAVIQVDSTPFKQYYLQHYGVELGLKKKIAAVEEATGGQEHITSQAEKACPPVRAWGCQAAIRLHSGTTGSPTCILACAEPSS